METLKNYLKQEIKTLAAEQKVCRNQRKTVHIKGERTMTAHEARWTHKSNRCELFNLYIVYGTLRGRTVEQIAKEWVEYYTPDYIEKLMVYYQEKFEKKAA